jgi:hypothetical protein
MPTNIPPGLRDLSSTLDVPIELVMFLIRVLWPRWRREHPQHRKGRRRAPFVGLLAGALIYLRQAGTFRSAAAQAGLPRSTLHDAFHPLMVLIAGLGICQADGTLLDEEGLQQWCREMAEHGELALLDGVPTRAPRPGASWAAQKPMWDPLCRVRHSGSYADPPVMPTVAGERLVGTVPARTGSA